MDEHAGEGSVLEVSDFTVEDAEAFARRAAARRQRRGEPWADPATRRLSHDQVACDVSREDLRAIVRGVVQATVAAGLRAETARALDRARGRVD